MNRLFDRHTQRRVQSLDGFWQFQVDPNDIGVAEQWYLQMPADSRRLLVPGCWNNELGLYHYEGSAWYSRSFTCTTPQVQLLFHGFTGQMDVYVNGRRVASQYGGFTGMAVVVENLEPGEHQLAVRVDNTHNDRNTIPLARVDWFHYGGLFRSIELHELPDVWLQDAQIRYELDRNARSVSLTMDVTIQSFGAETEERLTVEVNGEELCSVPVAMAAAGATQVQISEQTLRDVQLWDCDAPHLYLFRFTLGDDDLQERIGFRTVEVNDGQLLLNGRPLNLKGVNRHEDHPDWGFAIPLHLMRKDVEIIKMLGCNTIRGSHYPNHPVFLDLLDEEGIVFWEEIPMWGFPEQALADPLTRERGLAMHKAMVCRDLHHPSIILWGLHNEIDTRTQAGLQISQAFAEQVKTLDTSRPLTYATHHPLDDICLSTADIVSVNKYFGWYEGDIERWEQFLVDLKAKLQWEGRPHMPIIISEFGAGAIYGDNTFEAPKWTEGYQTDYLAYTLELFDSDPAIIGTYVWQYCDIRTARELDLGRPRSFNNKGIVNEYRKPKQAFWKVQERYAKQR